MTTRVFLYGALRDPDLRRIVLGGEVPSRPATLARHAVRSVARAPYPALVAEDGETAVGEVVDLAGAFLRRLDFYEACFGCAGRSVDLPDGTARAYMPPSSPATGGPWDRPEWARRWAHLSREAAREVMEHLDRRSPEWVSAHFSQILSRADAAVRAATTGPPQTLRRGLTRADVELVRHSRPYSGFFSMVDQELRFRRFDGDWSQPVTRSGLIAGDAVTVLPYDPALDAVLLVEQFRFGPWSRGDTAPWMLEPIAGRIDPGEDAEETARREAHEEAGITIGRLEHVGSYYASTGCLSEYVISYVGLCDLSDRGGGVAGAEDEGEDILSHLVGFDRLMGLLASGEAEDAPLLISAYWLAAHRDRLRGGRDTPIA